MSRIGHGLRRGRYVAAAASGPPVAGYDIWIDFSDLSSLTLVGSDISQANDKSGNGNHVAQSTSGRRPTSTTSSLIGASALSVARFDGTDDELFSSTTVTSGGANARTSLVAAVKRTSGITSGNSDVVMSDPWSMFVASGPQIAIWTGAVTTVSATSTDWTTAKVHTRRHNGLSQTEAWTNLTSRVTASHGSSTGNLRLGAEGNNFHGDWDIGEYVSYPSALGTTDREAVVSYLMAKWGIT